MSNGRMRCACPRCSVSALMGPVILITLGVLFLLGQMIDGLSFGRLWPVLLVVIGLIKLVEGMSSTEGHTGS